MGVQLYIHFSKCTSELKRRKKGEEEETKEPTITAGEEGSVRNGTEITERVSRAGGATAGPSPPGAAAAAGGWQRAAAHGRSRGPTPDAAVGREGAVRHGRAAAPPRASVTVPSAGGRMRRSGPGGAPRKQSGVLFLPGRL